MVRILYIWILVFFALSLSAQKIDAFATAKTSKKKVMLEQGFKVKVKAYSSTWFAKPLQFDNIQMEGAFIQSFKRTLSSMSTVNRKKYASLEFYYIVFPYQTGELTFPAIEIKANIPPEGDYKGQDIILKTEAFTVLVEEVPDGYEEEKWMVASDVRGAKATFRGAIQYYEIGVGEIISLEKKNEKEYHFLEKYSETIYRLSIIKFEEIS